MLSILLAITLDILFKDPPNALHPTAWMGKIIYGLWRKKAPKNRTLAFMKGVLITLIPAASFGLVAHTITQFLSYASLPDVITSIIIGFLLFLTISFNRLLQVGEIILAELESGNITGARRSLSYHLVSRDTSQLNESEVCAATLESLSENLTDGLTAPLCMYLVFGLPGAVIYRVINTCDAMLGYRDPEREWLGKFPARLDDLLNLIPARITGFVILLAGLISVGLHRGLRVLLHDHSKTDSPNAGWTMAALAGVLGIQLGKQDCYVLNPAGREPKIIHLIKGISVCKKSGYLFFIFTLILLKGFGYGL